MATLGVTDDKILGGRVHIRQPADGYRVNVDTILLAASLPALAPGARAIELGCGIGAAVLAAARKAADVSFLGLERDARYAALARQNVGLNDWARNVDIVEGDAFDTTLTLGTFDAVFLNPPYDTVGEGRAPAEGKRAAFIADRPIADWIRVWSNAMRARACLVMIHRAQRLPEILAALEGRLGGAEVFPVRAHSEAPAQRVIVRAYKGSRAPLRLLRGLDLHPSEADGKKYTREAEAILSGEAPIMF